MKKLSGCKVVNRSGFCEECENEYKLNDGNFCELRNITLDQNCLKLNGKLCKKCREGYFVNHFGNLNFGHYTATVKNADGWYDCDDSSIRKTKLDGNSAYILFYKQID